MYLSSDYDIESFSSLCGGRLVLKHLSKKSHLGIFSIRVPICVMTELRLCTFVCCSQQRLANIISQCLLHKLTSTSGTLITGHMPKECFNLHLNIEALQQLLKEKVQSSIAFRKSQVNKTFSDSLGCTVQFAGGIKKDDSIYIAQRCRILSISGAENCNELDASTWIMEFLKDIWIVSLINSQAAGVEEFEADRIFKILLHCSSLRLSVRKIWRFWEGNQYECNESRKVQSHTTSKNRHPESSQIKAENLNGVIVLSLMRIIVQGVTSKMASEVLNLFLQLFKDAFPTLSVGKMNTEKVKLEIIQLENQFGILNNRNRSYTQALFNPDIEVVYVYLRACTFRKIESYRIGLVHDFMVMYSCDRK